ncbi:MAG: hydroxyacylglutathione hydrolase [Methylophaga sp.]
MLTVHTIKAFQDNYIWLIQAENSQKVLIVDPGDAIPVLEALEKMHLSPAAILITHHHADHTGGITAILNHYTVPVFAPANESVPAVTHPLQDTGELALSPDFPPFRILATPGHTAGHICYLTENKLFCGDTLFAGGCGRLLGGSAEQLFNSLQQLKQLPAETEVYCAHEYTEANLRFAETVDPGNKALQQRIINTRRTRKQGLPTVPSLMADELATNPFLRSHLPEIKKAAEQFAGRPLSDSQDVFTTLRHWKDVF